MKLFKKPSAQIASAALIAVLFAGSALAQAWPQRPVKIVSIQIKGLTVP